MGGAAASLGAFLALSGKLVSVNLTCYLALAENMVSGSSMRPGDVYLSHNGLSVEIDNTDAEGRLVLADAISVCAGDRPDWIIDLATLTGAARVALGGGVDALFSSDSQLQETLFQSGLETGDLVWPLPLFDEYEKSLDSSVADIVNSAPGGHGGAITAALFLLKFTSQIPWSHVDTFMWSEKPTVLCSESGPTAKCVRLVETAIRRFARV
jgi:leucyl aminopeptidase